MIVWIVGLLIALLDAAVIRLVLRLEIRRISRVFWIVSVLLLPGIGVSLFYLFGPPVRVKRFVK